MHLPHSKGRTAVQKQQCLCRLTCNEVHRAGRCGEHWEAEMGARPGHAAGIRNGGRNPSAEACRDDTLSLHSLAEKASRDPGQWPGRSPCRPPPDIRHKMDEQAIRKPFSDCTWDACQDIGIPLSSLEVRASSASISSDNLAKVVCVPFKVRSRQQ